MKITIFSSNQPRHINLVDKLSKIAEKVFYVNETNTVFPGKIADFYKKSSVMQTYFSNVINAEKNLFGDIKFLPENVFNLAIKRGDLNSLSKQQLGEALFSDIYIVFGASFIKGWLMEYLVSKKAINIHTGILPYYRGSACNFWALYDESPEYVGATIHMLSSGLDKGDILFHCLPKYKKGESSFDFTMRSITIAQECLINKIKDKEIFSIKPLVQDYKKLIRYSRNNEFTDEIARDFLNKKLDLEKIDFKYPNLYNPLFE